MKTGRTLTDLAAELQRQAESKKDYLADTRALVLRPQGGREGADLGTVLDGINGGLPINPTAHAQIASTLGIPKPYYDRMLSEQPDLLCDNVNRWLHANPARRLVRTLDGKVRAFLSASYRPLDNYDLAEAVLPQLQQLGAHVVSAEVTPHRFYLKAVTERISGEVKVGDRVQAGIVVSNSEIGQGALSISALDFRLVCTNGMIRDQAIRKAHLGRGQKSNLDAIEDAREFYRDETRLADDRAFFLKTRDAVGSMFDQARFDQRLNQYRAAGELLLPAGPVQIVETTARRLGLTEGEQSSVLEHLIRGGELTAWGLANAVTRAAADVDDYDRATEMEQLGGAVIDLKPADWRALAS